MIKNNKFYINNLRDIIILGESQRSKELISINKRLNLNTTIITSSHQSKLIDKSTEGRDVSVLFGDGAGAAILTRSENDHGFSFNTTFLNRFMNLTYGPINFHDDITIKAQFTFS